VEVDAVEVPRGLEGYSTAPHWAFWPKKEGKIMQNHPCKILGLLALALTLLLGVSGPVNAAQATFITQADCCPVTITQPGTYVLDEQLTVTGNTPGIEISVSNVVLFCEFGGCVGSARECGPSGAGVIVPSIKGPGQVGVNSPTSIGIVVRNSSNVTVDSCTVTNFTEGFGLRDSNGNLFQNNRAEFNRDGFDLDNSNQNAFLRNMVRLNGSDGIDLDNSNGNVFNTKHCKYKWRKWF
jgi:parallel beta-helix repeat protein